MEHHRTGGAAALGLSAPTNVPQDIACLFVDPPRLFDELRLHNRSTTALLLFLVLQIAYAAALLSTGVSDYEIDVRTQHDIAQKLIEFDGVSEEEGFTASLTQIEKQAAFDKLLVRVRLCLGGPVASIMTVSLVGGICFVIVAMRGGKPKFEILSGVVSYALWVEAPRMLLRLYLVSQIHAARVETSAAALADPSASDLAAYVLLRRLDPFDCWFWGLVAYGVARTGQMSRRTAIVTVVTLALFATLINIGVDVADLAKFEWIDVSQAEAW